MTDKNKTTGNFFSSIFWKISATFLIILLILSAVYLFISVRTAELYFQETHQKLNSEVAPHIAAENKCFVNGQANEAALHDVFHDIMIINPSIEVYLLDTTGKILTYFAPNKIIELEYVELAPIEQFINDKGKNYILGPDPKNPEKEKAFSAARVYENTDFMGYIYVVLESEQYESTSQYLFGSYILNLGLTSMGITLIAAIVIGLIALGYITRNLRKILFVIRQFRDDNINARIKIKGKGEINELAAAFNEMADRIASNIEEMKTMDNLRRELVANVSHDLRTPLATIQGYIETILIKADSLDDDQRKQYMHTILSSTEKLKRLVTELFELSKLEAKQIKLKQEPFAIADLIQDIRQKNLIIAEAKEINIDLQSPFNLPLVYADIGMMEKVLQNLIENAIKYSDNGGNIKISLEHRQSDIVVNIQDNGSGIDPDELPHIFDRYHRSTRHSPSTDDGLGLGLAIVKKILDLHNIEINVKSAKNDGTTFIFYLPVYSGISKKQSEKVYS